MVRHTLVLVQVAVSMWVQEHATVAHVHTKIVAWLHVPTSLL